MRFHFTPLFALAIALALGCASSQQTESRVVASGTDISITLAELDEQVREQLFLERTQGGNPALVYQLRSEALDVLIRDRVLEAESKRGQVSVEEFLASNSPEVSDEEVTAFYEENKGRMNGAALTDVDDQVRQFLGQQKEAEAIAKLVESSGVEIALDPPRSEVEPIGPSRGPADAPITIVEFSDFQCPFCTRALPIVSELFARYPNEIRLVYRHLPLESIHPRARPAAIAAGCAEDQDQFWAYHDALFTNPGAFSDADFSRIATETKLDLPAFDTCYGAKATEPRVDADIEAARSVGITGTPAFFVNGILLKGAQPVEAFEKIITRELASADNPTP